MVYDYFFSEEKNEFYHKNLHIYFSNSLLKRMAIFMFTLDKNKFFSSKNDFFLLFFLMGFCMINIFVVPTQVIITFSNVSLTEPRFFKIYPHTTKEFLYG